MPEIPAGFDSQFVASGDVEIHVVHNVRKGDDRPAVLFLHGFPEYWAGWRPVMELLKDSHAIAAPDQRGYNLSDAPQEVEAYAPAKLVADALAVAEHFFAGRRFFLAGHDWGASIAYALAIGHGKRLAGLIIANGVHPVCFQKALITDDGQRQASQYFHYLRHADAAQKLAEDNYRRTLDMLRKFSDSPWLTEAERAGYLSAWSRPGRLNAMLNWYRASPIVVPKPDQPAPEAPLADGSPERFGLSMPHLLLWGERDVALLPVSLEGLERFAPALETVKITEGDHWLIHQYPDRIAGEIGRFIRQTGTG